jgi:hypothetical protein
LDGLIKKTREWTRQAVLDEIIRRRKAGKSLRSKHVTDDGHEAVAGPIRPRWTRSGPASKEGCP